MMERRKRVAVIGAGLSGLAAIKSFKEEELEPTCFETTGHIGGLWKYREDDIDGVASVMKTTIINSSKELGAISDFPPPAEYPNYMHHSLMYEYIKSAAEKFHLMEHIKFHHETLKIEKAEDYEETGRWKVTNRNRTTNEVTTDTFDCVAVCIGHHAYPNMPVFPGQEGFTGRILHSRRLKNTQGFEDTNVVVVGVGNSGMDAAVELSSVAKNVYLSTRTGTWVFPKIGPSGLPLDIVLLRRPIALAVRYLPNVLLSFLSEKILNLSFDHSLYNLKPEHGVWSQHPTMNDSIPLKLLSGVVTTRGNIKKFTKNGLIFENEEIETPVDVVILATGYQVKFPFLSEDIVPVKNNRVPLYKYIFPPDLPHPTLAIFGQVQPFGPGIPIGEMQCRWTSRVMSDKLSLPHKEKMYADIKKSDDFIKERFTASPRHTIEIDYIAYMDELASEIGAKPNLLNLAITDPKLFWAVYFGPFLPYQYRLRGPHAWNKARNAILTFYERVAAPFHRPGQKLDKRKYIFSFRTALKLFFLLFLIKYFIRLMKFLNNKIGLFDYILNVYRKLNALFLNILVK